MDSSSNSLHSNLQDVPQQLQQVPEEEKEQSAGS